MIEKKKLVQFGAGKIGRSFIGQLFSLSGYEVVFIDVYKPVVEALNNRRQYQVVIKSDHDELLLIEKGQNEECCGGALNLQFDARVIFAGDLYITQNDALEKVELYAAYLDIEIKLLRCFLGYLCFDYIG